jgi:hypothetical protein
MKPLPLRSALALACLLAGLPAAAQTLLLVVQENANSKPLPPPSGVRESLTSDLFDAGYIVLDAPGSSPLRVAAELAQVGQSAGADIVLTVATDYSDAPLGDLLRISARTTYALIESTTGATLAHGPREATNKDRERDVSRTVLGGEIGRDVAARVKAVLERRGGE